MKIHSLLTVPDGVKVPEAEEFFQTLVTGAGHFTLERIVSWGHITPEDKWYDQDHDEWVVILAGAARLLMENGQELIMKTGDYLHIQRHVRHRVIHTSHPCIWLAVHASTLTSEKQ